MYPKEPLFFSIKKQVSLVIGRCMLKYHQNDSGFERKAFLEEIKFFRHT